jgi:hypothetical protein
MITYLTGLLILNSWLLLWFFSPLKSSIGYFILKKEVTNLDFDDYLFIKNKFLSKLLSCWICLSFWSSLVIGFLLTFNVLWALLCFFTYPGLAYIFYSFIKR